MKKLLTLLLCLVFAISAFAMCGCKDKIFEGNYTVATEQEIASLIKITNSLEDSNKLDFASGLQVRCTKTITGYYGAYYEYNIGFKAVSQRSRLMMKGNGNVEYKNYLSSSYSADESIYYCDGYAYTKTNNGSSVNKTKYSVSHEALLADYLTPAKDYFVLLEDMMLSLEDESSVTWAVAKSNLYTKVKVEFDVIINYTVLEETAVYVYDKTYKLVALTIDAVYTETDYQQQKRTTTVNIVIEPWTGLIVSPINKNRYTEI